MDIVTIIVLLVAGVVGLAAQYFIIQAAVLSALRQHTMNSRTAVSIVSSIPLTIADVESAESPQTSHQAP